MRVQNVTPCVHVRYSMFFSMPVCRYPVETRNSFTVSPSMSRMRRSTPCVEGWTGPMLTTMRSSLTRSASATMSAQSPPEAVYSRSPGSSRAGPVAWKVLIS